MCSCICRHCIHFQKPLFWLYHICYYNIILSFYLCAFAEQHRYKPVIYLWNIGSMLLNFKIYFPLFLFWKNILRQNFSHLWNTSSSSRRYITIPFWYNIPMPLFRSRLINIIYLIIIASNIFSYGNYAAFLLILEKWVSLVFNSKIFSYVRFYQNMQNVWIHENSILITCQKF